MKHFSAEKWSDFVRNQSPPPEREAMQAHLENGCAKCGETVAWLNDVVKQAAFDSSFEVPSESVARARSIFQAPESRDWVDRLQQLVAELVTETHPDWQPAGVRSGAVDCIRMLYRAGDYAVDLNVESLSGNGCDIVGQIANERDAKDDLGGVLVQLVSAGRTVGEAETNQFGEFVLEQPDLSNTVLRIALRNQGKRIELPLQSRQTIVDPS